MLPFARAHRPAPAETPLPSEEHVSRAFPQLLASLPERGATVILDLGPAWGDNLTFWRGRAGRLAFADLWESAAGGFRPTADQAVGAAREALGWLEGHPPTLILAWDLFDHLGREEMHAIAEVLGAAAVPGTRLFAIVSARGAVPEAPRLHRIAREDLLRLDPAAHERKPPFYREPDLCRLLPGFRVEATHLLRNGMQEYVFVYDPPGAAAALATMRATGGAPPAVARLAPLAAAPSPSRPPVTSSVIAAAPADRSPALPSAARPPVVTPSAEPSRIRPSFVPPKRLELPRPKNPKLPSR